MSNLLSFNKLKKKPVKKRPVTEPVKKRPTTDPATTLNKHKHLSYGKY